MMWILGFSALFLVTAFGKDKAVDYLDEQTEWWVRFDSLYKKYGQKYGVRWEWLKATALVESDNGRAKSVAEGMRDPANASHGGIDDSKSSDGLSWGLMQVTLTTAKDFDPTATITKLNNPEYSVDLSARYWARTMRQFPDTKDPRWLEWIVKSYNQGAGATMLERAGKISGYTGNYWEKWQKAYKRIMEGQK